MEFFCETGQPLVMYTMDRFMENAGSALGTKISRKNIEEAQEASRNNA